MNVRHAEIQALRRKLPAIKQNSTVTTSQTRPTDSVSSSWRDGKRSPFSSIQFTGTSRKRRVSVLALVETSRTSRLSLRTSPLNEHTRDQRTWVDPERINEPIAVFPSRKHGRTSLASYIAHHSLSRKFAFRATIYMDSLQRLCISSPDDDIGMSTPA